MENCLLCLELKEEFVETIDTKSKLWHELNITSILEKHLWPMDHIKTNPWMCTSCWRKLYEFHKFYLRIKEAHTIFDLLNGNSKVENSTTNNEDNKDNEILYDRENEVETNLCEKLSENSNTELKDVLKEYDISDEHYQNDFMIEEWQGEIKHELNEESLLDNSQTTQKRKRGRPRKNENDVAGNTIFDLLNGNSKVENSATNNEDNKDNEILNDRENEVEANLCDKLSESSNTELEDVLNEYDLSDEHYQNDFMIEELQGEIKNELNEESLLGNSQTTQKRKRGRPRKNENAVDGNITNKHCKTKTNEASKTIDLAKQPKKVEQKLQMTNGKFENSSDFNNDTDQESLECIENKLNADKVRPPKNDHNEKDKFLKENFKIVCHLCNITFETFFNMRKHFDKHHTELGHVRCCNKKFYRRSILVDHVHFHLNPNYFKCSQCGKVMADRRCLELHAKIHESNQGKNHCCNICGKGFVKLGVLKTHRMIHLSEEEKRFSCSDCGKKFGSNYMLTNHRRTTHLKIYYKICEICGKSIQSKTIFERHMLQHEGKSAPSASCDICGLLLTDEKALERHKKVIHPENGQKMYTCSICTKISPNLRTHKLHVQFTHEGGYNYKCTICDKAFKRAQPLKEHMASHTGEILYTCPWCPKTFNSNANMHNHRKKIHPKEWEENLRKRYSGKLPPRFKPPHITEHTDATAS